MQELICSTVHNDDHAPMVTLSNVIDICLSGSVQQM